MKNRDLFWVLFLLLVLVLLLWQVLQAQQPPAPQPSARRVLWILPAGGTLWDRVELAGSRDPRIWLHEIGNLNGWGNRVPLLRAGEQVKLVDWREKNE